jgi:dipeptidyl-peptidase 4
VRITNEGNSFFQGTCDIVSTLRMSLHTGSPRRIASGTASAGTKVTEFILVDAPRNTSGPAFDHARLAVSLSKAAKREYQSTELPFDTFDYARDGKSISFQVEGTLWTCELEDYECKKGPEPVAGQYEEASPNKEWVVYVNEHDLYLRFVSRGRLYA